MLGSAPPFVAPGVHVEESTKLGRGVILFDKTVVPLIGEGKNASDKPFVVELATKGPDEVGTSTVGDMEGTEFRGAADVLDISNQFELVLNILNGMQDTMRCSQKCTPCGTSDERPDASRHHPS